MKIHVNVQFCLYLHSLRVKIFFKTCKLENNDLSVAIKILYLMFKRSADLDNTLAMIIHGNVW